MATSFLYGMFGVSAAFAVFCLSYFLTGTPCNKVTELSTGQHAVCRASSSTGRIVVTAGLGTTSYHFRALPPVRAGAGTAVWQNTTTKLPSAGFAALSYTMLPGSHLSYNITAGIDAYFYITDYKGYFNLRFGRAHSAFVDADAAPRRTFVGTFARAPTDPAADVYLVVRNPQIKERSVAWLVEGTLAQYDVAGAADTCTGTARCVFADVSPSSVVITVGPPAHNDTAAGRAVDTTVAVAQSTEYAAATQAGWGVAGAAVFVAVLLFFIPGLHRENEKARKETRQQKELARKKREEDEVAIL